MNYLELCNKPFFNGGSEKIPGFALLEIYDWRVDFEGRGLPVVRKPKAGAKLLLINAPWPVEGNSPGSGTDHLGAWVLVDPDAGTLSNPTEIGPVDGKWYAGKSGKGLVVIGNADGQPASEPGFPAADATKRVRVGKIGGGGGSPLIVGALRKTIEPGGIDATKRWFSWGRTKDAVELLKTNTADGRYEPDTVAGTNPPQAQLLYGVNRSQSQMRGSEDELVLVDGFETEIKDGEQMVRAFVVVPSLDLRIMEFFELTPPNGLLAQVPRHTAGSRRFGLGGKKCS